jgi:hypothetical protein
MAIALPTLPIPLQATARMLDFDVSQTPPFGGVTRNYGRLGSRHALDVVIGALDGDCAGEWIAARRKARVTGVPVRLPFPQPEGLASTLTGVLVNGANQSGRLLNVDGLSTLPTSGNYLLRAADPSSGSWTFTNASLGSAGSVYIPGASSMNMSEGTGSGEHKAVQTISTANGPVTLSAAATQNGRNQMMLRMVTTGGTYEALFDVTAGTVLSVTSGATAQIHLIAGSGNQYRCFIWPNVDRAVTSVAVLMANASGAVTYTGTNASLYWYAPMLAPVRGVTDWVATTSAAVVNYSTLVKAGAAFSIVVSGRSYLYLVTDDLTGSAAGSAALGLDCQLRASPADNTALEFVTPIIEGWLTARDDWTIERLIATSFDLSIDEAA